MNLNPRVTNTVQAKYLPHICWLKTRHPLPFALCFTKWQPAAKSARNHLFWGQDLTARPNCTARSTKIPSRKRPRWWYTRQIPVVGKSIVPVDTALRRHRTKTRRYCLGKEKHGIKGRVMGTECTRDRVGLPAPPGPPGEQRLPIRQTPSPPGECVSLLAHAAGLLGARWSWLTGSHGASLPRHSPGRLAICHRSYGGWSVCTLPHFQKSGSRNKTTLGIVRSDQPAQTPENSHVAWLYWSSGEFSLIKDASRLVVPRCVSLQTWQPAAAASAAAVARRGWAALYLRKCGNSSQKQTTRLSLIELYQVYTVLRLSLSEPEHRQGELAASQRG